MASIIRVKRSTSVGAPPALGLGEIAYSYLGGGNGKFYIGSGTETGGNASGREVIGGAFYTQLLDHTAGTTTPSAALIVDADSKLDVINVDNVTINGNTISATDVNGNLILGANGTGIVNFTSNIQSNGKVVIADSTNATPNSQNGALVVTNGGAYISGNMRVGGTLYAVLQGSVIDDTAIGGNTPSTGDFTQISTTGNATIGGALSVTGAASAASLSTTGNGSIGGNLTVVGNLVVQGTTTTVESSVVTINDPIFTLSGTAVLTTNDAKDRGIEFKYYSGAAKTGFFGYDESTGYFTFIPDATNTSEVFSGTKGIIDVTAVTGTAAAWTTARTVTFGGGDTTGTFTIDGSADVTGITLTTVDATDTVKGIASFAADTFTVTAGAVVLSVVDGGTY